MFWVRFPEVEGDRILPAQEVQFSGSVIQLKLLPSPQPLYVANYSQATQADQPQVDLLGHSVGERGSCWLAFAQCSSPNGCEVYEAVLNTRKGALHEQGNLYWH